MAFKLLSSKNLNFKILKKDITMVGLHYRGDKFIMQFEETSISQIDDLKKKT